MKFLSKQLFFIFLIFTLILSFLQFRVTKRTDFINLTEMERIGQLRRMNEYPPSAYRLANWIEARKESIIYFKLEKNFITIFDLNYFFGGLFKPLLFPLFLYGYFELLKQRNKEVLIISVIPLILITIIGHDNPYGLISLYPVIYGSIVYTIYRIFNIFRKS